MQERLFTIHQVADLCGATSTQVLQWVRRGWLPSQNLPDGPVRIPERGLIQFFKRQGIDIMQLMISSAVKDGPKPRRPVKTPAPRPAPAAVAEPTAGELPMCLADLPPAVDARQRPSAAPDEDDEQDLAVREMLAGIRPAPEGEDRTEDLPDAPPPIEPAAPDEPSGGPAERAEFDDELLGPAGGEGPTPAPPEEPAPNEPDDEPTESAQEPADRPRPAGASDAVEQVALAILEDAVTRAASHIHLERRADGPALRLRVDGVLRAKPRFAERLPGDLAAGLFERLLRWAGIEPAEADRPQAGRFSRAVAGGEVGFELSAFPTTTGPRLVLAVRDRRTGLSGLAGLGLPTETRERLERIVLAEGGGMVLVATASGADGDPVLRALAATLARDGRSVLTVEAEDRGPAIPGACRACTAPLEGYSFSAAARGAFEQDADALLLGQLRDPVTATVAMESALAGRMVLAGVRAATAAAAIELLTEMDLEPWPLASALRVVAVVRRVRRLCDDCKQPADPRAEMLAALGLPPALSEQTLYKPVGCGRCGVTGYRGVVRLISVLVPDRRVTRLIRSCAGAEALNAASAEGGVNALRQLAAKQLAAGRTSLDEVARIL